MLGAASCAVDIVKVSSVLLKLAKGLFPIVTLAIPPARVAFGTRNLSTKPPGGAKSFGKYMFAVTILLEEIWDFKTIDSRPKGLVALDTAIVSPSSNHTRGSARPIHRASVIGSTQTSAHFSKIGAVRPAGVAKDGETYTFHTKKQGTHGRH